LDRELLPLMVYAIRSLASFVGSNPTDLVLIPNATTGLNIGILLLLSYWNPVGIEHSFLICKVCLRLGIVLKSLQYTKEDHIIRINITYGSIVKMLTNTGATVDEVKIWFPTTAEDIIKKVEAAICPNTRLAVLDHITSNTAIVLPMKQLVDMLNKR
jgi:isopenicillin-N epimerase